MKIQAKDLMVGDWVKFKNSDLAHKVIAVAGKSIKVDKTHWYSANIFDPIHLTPVVLEKIGFETQPNIGYIIDDWDGTQIIYDSWNYNLRIIKDYKTCLDIKTFDDTAVHELQHALRLCGIEKEIVL
jgi:hypothetical protein